MATSGAIGKGKRVFSPPSQNNLEVQPLNLRVYITQQIQTPPAKSGCALDRELSDPQPLSLN